MREDTRKNRSGPLLPLSVLYEDNHLLAVLKPVGWATMGLPAGEETLLSRARSYIKEKYEKPGNVYLGVVSRLDVPVSGVVLFARTSKAAERLNDQFRRHAVEKEYLALVEGLPPLQDRCVDWIVEDERHRKVHLTRHPGAGAKEARLSYERLARVGSCSLLRVRLETGRKHQIRIQLSGRGFPILGDGKYGATIRLPAGIALHAARLRVRHPVREEALDLRAPLPEFWKQWMPVDTLPEG